MYHFQTDEVITPNGAEIEPVTVRMVSQDLQLEESATANQERLALLIKRARSEVESALNKRIAIVTMRTEFCTADDTVYLPAPLIEIAFMEVKGEDGEWHQVQTPATHSDRQIPLAPDLKNQVIRVTYSVGMVNCPYDIISDIMEGVRAMSAGQPWTPPAYPGRRVNV